MTSSLASWYPAPERLPLNADEVHVWRVSLEQGDAKVEAFYGTLAADERQRAEKFYFKKDRDHFVVGRGVLRLILGRYLNVEPASLRFLYNDYGKPALAEEDADEPLRFNISHSNGVALCAFTRGREIGIDIEHVRQDVEGENIAGHFFSPDEIRALRALPHDARPRAFFDCWTRKEAYIKAHGEGLSLPLNGFDVTLAPGEPAALLRTAHDPAQAARWSLRELSPGEGYVAALAVEGHDWRLRCWQWGK